MTRGKYKNASEARRVRESALSEVEAGRRTIVRLTSENEDLRETLSRDRANLTEKLRVANSLIAEGSSAEVEALRQELARSREETQQARRHIAMAVQKLMQRSDFRATFTFYSECADALGLTVQELMPRAVTGNRNARRATAKTLKMLQEFDPLLTPTEMGGAFEGYGSGFESGKASR